MRFFRERSGGARKQEQKEDEPITQAREALVKYLEYLKGLDPDSNETEMEKRVKMETEAAMPGCSLDEIKQSVQNAIDSLDQGSLKLAMAFLSARDDNLIKHYWGAEEYFSKATETLREYLNSKIASGERKVEDEATSIRHIRKGTTEIPQASSIVEKNYDNEILKIILEHDVSLYLLPIGKIGVSLDGGEIKLEDSHNNKWMRFFTTRSKGKL